MSLDTWTGGPPTAAEAADSDAWLWRVMQSEKNKAMIARLEESLRAFLEDADQMLLPFPPRNAFHRKVCYLVARRYGLAHRLEQHPDPTIAPAVRLVLIKTPHSAQPPDSLAQLADRPPPDALKDSAARGGAVAAQKSAQRVESPETSRPATTSTILRRPRTADGKTTRALHSAGASCALPAASTLKSISEEDYRKARARIFKNLGSQPNEQGRVEQDSESAEASSANDQARVLKIGHIAKGPVQGSTGFDRRRNRRNVTSQGGHSAGFDKAQKRVQGDKSGNGRSNGPIEPSKEHGRAQQAYNRPAREQRPIQDQAQAQKSFAALSLNNGATNGSFVQPAVNDSRRSLLSGSNNSQSDLQDPDFDRRYDKWAVRREAHHPSPHAQQQIPVPIFSQLLYPYAVQASTPHLHPSALHMGSVNSAGGPVQHGNVEQYQSMPMHHHTPSGAVMMQHIGQGIGGLAAEYIGRSMAMSDQVSPYEIPRVDHLASGHPREISVLQRQSISPPVARAPSPAYGLDSTVDFPPLP